jgi:Transposase
MKDCQFSSAFPHSPMIIPALHSFKTRAMSPTSVAGAGLPKASLAAAGEAAVVNGCGGLPVVVVNPAEVRSLAQALGKRARTDPIDAAVIAHFVEPTKPDIRPLKDEATRLLADLVTRRRQIIEMIVAERQRQRRVVEKHLQMSIARLLKAPQKELSSLDQDIDDAVRGSPAWPRKRRPARLGAWRRAGNRANVHRGIAGTRHARPQADRGARPKSAGCTVETSCRWRHHQGRRAEGGLSYPNSLISQA